MTALNAVDEDGAGAAVIKEFQGGNLPGSIVVALGAANIRTVFGRIIAVQPDVRNTGD